ncbi:pilus assembly protein TadG-related protein [Aquamicrobium sp. NLF2-7]|uniref:TadG family pilus assembly protein n=1 Tax=Aquamicrobium sp. NLF2-7 TaxID=2918753 RepID=UPI001EFC061B|nr:TadG family pilus assembly protein [Aquamicrobium sp. NLF2-7]MCG8273092.1 pilus assembly protein TadG-related protein [Aquamicrobium sp. NLF2-7]
MHEPPAAAPQSPRHFLRNRTGNFAVMTALIMPFAVVLTAFAVDQGSLYTERRHAQAITDIAAIAATGNMSKAEAMVAATLSDNGLGQVLVRGAGDTTKPLPGRPVANVIRGRYTPDPSKPRASRFVPGQQPYNAVEVSLEKLGNLYFGSSVMAPPVIGTSAIASMKSEAAFSVGSRLLQLDGGLANALLGALLGGNINLNVMDYRALAAADVSVLSFLDALAIRTNATALTYSDLLSTTATVGQIAAAMADVPGLDSVSRIALQTLGAQSSASLLVSLNTLIDLGSVGQLGIGQRPAGLDIAANVLSMLTASAAIANGDNMVAANLGGMLPGLGGLKLKIAIGEPPQRSPWLAVGEEGTVVRTAQTRVSLVASVSPLSSNLGGGIHLLSINLPLHVEVAYAEARLKSIECPTGRPESLRVTIDTTPGIAELYIAEAYGSGFADFTRKMMFRAVAIADVSLNILFVIKLDLLKIKGFAHAMMGNDVAIPLTFTQSDIAAKKTKTATTSNYTSSLTSTLIDDLKLSVEPLGLPIDIGWLLGVVKPPVQLALGAVTPVLDKLLYNLLGVLGISLGQADVRVTGATCGRALLVQ